MSFQALILLFNEVGKHSVIPSDLIVFSQVVHVIFRIKTRATFIRIMRAIGHVLYLWLISFTGKYAVSFGVSSIAESRTDYSVAMLLLGTQSKCAALGGLG